MAGHVQLVLKGLEDTYLTGSPQITYFKSVFSNFDQFEIKYHENQFYATNVAFGKPQLCIIKRYGDLIRNNFLKVKLPSIFVTNSPNYVWCYPNKPASQFRPDIYLFDSGFNEIGKLTTKDTCVYYNTAQSTWLPPGVSTNLTTNKFDLNLDCAYIGFDTTDEALFWGFKNYDSDISYRIFRNSRYVFKNTKTSEITLESAGWVQQFSKYLRTYKPDVGSILIDRVDLFVGAQLIETIPGQYLRIYKDLQIPQQLQKSLDSLEGATPQEFTSDFIVYYVYLPLSLKNIPICALTRQDVEIRISFNTFENLLPQEFLNISEQFKQISSLDATAYSSVYDGNDVYFLSTNGIINRNHTFDTTIVPTSVIRANQDLYVATLDSNIIKYNTVSNVSSSFSYLKSYTVKPSVGLVYTTTLLNFTPNGIVQNLGSDINEIFIDVTSIRAVTYFRTYIFLILVDKIQIYNESFKKITEYSIQSVPTVFSQSPSTLYMLSDNTMYTYSTSFSQYPLPEKTPTAVTYKNGLYSFYQSGNVYLENTLYPLLIDVGNSFTSVNTIDPSNQSTVLYGIGKFNGYKYKEITNPDRYIHYTAIDRPILSMIKVTNTIFFVANNSISYTTQKGATVTSQLTTVLSNNVRSVYDDEKYIYILDDTFNLLVYDIISKQSTLRIYNQIGALNPKSLSYDGRYLYIFPSNGSTQIIKYDTNKSFQDTESYIVTSITDSVTTRPKQLYVLSTTFDGVNIYALPSARDGNAFVYNTMDSSYRFIDFVKDGRDYTPQDITNSIIVDKNLFMISSNGFYRYNTAFSGTSITTAPIQFSNAFLSVYDQINSNIYIFSNNFSADGFWYINTGSRDPTPTNVKPYTYQNTFTSYITYGSSYYLVSPSSNTGVIVKQTDPVNISTFSWSGIPNSSNTSILVGSKIYIFPGPSSSNTIVYDVITRQSNVITTPRRNYKTCTSYGNYIFLTDDSNIIRFNTTLDTFSDYSGYSILPSNTQINTSDYIVTNLANVYFVGSNIIRYNIVSNTYTAFTGSLQGSTIGTSSLVNSNIYILKDNGTLYISNIISTNIASKDDTPVDVTGNAQYIFTLFKNRLGRTEITNNGDFHGTGYYTSTSVSRPVTGNVTATIELNGNIYSVFDGNSVTAYNGSLYSNANIASKNTFTKAYTWNSNVIFIGNEFVMYNTTNTLTTANLVVTRFANTLSSFSNADSYFYFTNKTTNVLIQYDYTTKSNITYNSNVTGGFSEAYNYNSNLFFFPYESNTVLLYNTQTQNFQNASDIINRVTWSGQNVVSSHDNYVLTDMNKVYKLTYTNTLGEFVGYAVEFLNRRDKGYRIYINGDIYTDISGEYTFPPPYAYNKIICDVYFHEPGTYGTYQVNTPSFITNVEIYSGYEKDFITNKVTFFKSGTIISIPIPIITDKNYIVSADGKSLYNLETNIQYGKNTTTTQYYPIFGNVIVNDTEVLDIKYQTVEQMAREFSHRVQTLFGNVFVNAQKIDSQTMNIIATRDSPAVIANFKIGSNVAQVPGFIQYRFPPNVPIESVYLFSNVYSSPRFTYIFNSGTSDMIVYKNDTVYSTPLRSYPVPGNINTMIHQGIGTTTAIYMVTDNYSNVYRFNEESDSSSYINLNIVKTASGNFSNASMFSLSDGIGIVSDSNIYGFGIQNRFVNVYTENITNPLSFGSNVNFFTTTGSKYRRAQLNKISDIQNATYTEVPLSPGAFKYAFADSKYMYIVKTGNVIYGDKFVNISWDTRAFGKISQDLAYIVSSNTNNLLLSYTNTDRETYKTYQYNLPSIFSNTVQVYGNTAYMLPTASENIVAFNMDTRLFRYIPVKDYPVIYFSPNVYVTASNVNNVSFVASNINAVVDDGRYVSISTPSNVIQFDYVSNIFLPNKQIQSNTAIRSGSNVYFFSPTTVTRYSFNPRSYISIPIEQFSNGVQFHEGNVYFSSSTNVYRVDASLKTSNVIARALGIPGKSLLYNSNIAFSYPNTIMALDTTTGANSYITLAKNFNRFTVDQSNVFYTTMGMSVSRGTVINSDIVFSPEFKNLGPVFHYGSNMYALADNNTFVVYNANSLPFSVNAMFYSQNVSVVYTENGTAYYPPGLNGNVLQIFDMSRPFFSADAYTPVTVSNNNYKSFVTLSDSTYFIPTNSGNLINYVNGLETKGYTVPGGTLTSVYDGRSIYLANSSSVNRFYFTPLITRNAFGNAIYFTQSSNINNIIFDGASIYALSDVVYKINTSTIAESDATGMFQDTTQNILDRNLYTTGYFDGRFLNLVRDTVKIYDVNPLVYPQFFSPSIITEYIYVSDSERLLLQNRELKHMIKQLQYVMLPTNQYNRIDFWNPMSEIIINGKVSNFEFYLNGHEKVKCDGELSKLHILKHSRMPTRSNIFVYSFSSAPEEEFPDVTVNMSRIRDKVVRVDSTDSFVSLYGVTHNIVKFRDGLGGLVFNNSSQ